MARHRRGYTGERYTDPITVKLTPSQRAAVTAEAEARGMLLSDLARAKLIGKRLPKAGVDPQTIRALTVQIAHIGNNLNQLARIANQTGRIRSEQAIDALMAEIAETLLKVSAA
jgi:hypothetical protein